MPYANRADRLAQCRRWKANNQARMWFNNHKSSAKQRGVAFLLSYTEWKDLWGSLLSQRGHLPDHLCMCRHGDTGPYEVGNVYLATNRQNNQAQHGGDPSTQS